MNMSAAIKMKRSLTSEVSLAKIEKPAFVIRSRLVKALNTITNLLTVCSSAQYNIKTKLRIYQRCTSITLLESWVVTGQTYPHCPPFIFTCQRKIVRISWPRTVPNHAMYVRCLLVLSVYWPTLLVESNGQRWVRMPVGLLVMLWFRNVNNCIFYGIPVSYCSTKILKMIAVLTGVDSVERFIV